MDPFLIFVDVNCPQVCFISSRLVSRRYYLQTNTVNRAESKLTVSLGMSVHGADRRVYQAAFEFQLIAGVRMGKKIVSVDCFRATCEERKHTPANKKKSAR